MIVLVVEDKQIGFLMDQSASVKTDIMMMALKMNSASLAIFPVPLVLIPTYVFHANKGFSIMEHRKYAMNKR